MPRHSFQQIRVGDHRGSTATGRMLAGEANSHKTNSNQSDFGQQVAESDRSLNSPSHRTSKRSFQPTFPMRFRPLPDGFPSSSRREHLYRISRRDHDIYPARRGMRALRKGIVDVPLRRRACPLVSTHLEVNFEHEFSAGISRPLLRTNIHQVRKRGKTAKIGEAFDGLMTALEFSVFSPF